jgi:hypothetical protein
MLQALGILDGTWKPTKRKTRSKTDSLVTNPPPDVRVDIKQRGKELAIVLPRSSDAKMHCLVYAVAAVVLAVFGFLAQQTVANGSNVYSIIPYRMLVFSPVIVWCVPPRSWEDLKLSCGPARRGSNPGPTERHLSSFILAAR